MATETVAPAGPAPELPPPAAEPPPPDPGATQEQAAVAQPAKGKGAKAKKPRKGAESDTGTGAPDGAPSIAAHPRAARSIERLKGWGALAGFLVGGYLSLPTQTVAGAGLRALIAGAACWVAAWAASVFVWRRLIAIEIKAREAQLLAQAIARREAAAASAGDGGRARGGP